MEKLRELSSLLPAVTAITVFWSVIFNWTYFSVVGLEFYSLMSVSDQVNSWVSMTMPSMIVFVLTSALGINEFSFEAGKARALSSRPYKFFTRSWRFDFSAIVVFIIVVMLMIYLIFPAYDFNFMTVWVFGSVLLLFWAGEFFAATGAKPPYLLRKFSEMGFELSMVMVVSVLIACMGLIFAGNDIRKKARFEIHLEGVDRPISANVLRSFSTGLVVGAEDAIQFIPSSEISRIRRTLDTDSGAPRLCRIWSIWPACKSTQVP